MTRRESRTRPATTVPAPLPAPPAAETAPAPGPMGVRIAWGLALAWIAVLAALAINAANPVIINRRQVLAADLVVTARVVDLDAGRCAVEKQWTPGPPIDAVTVSNLKETRAVQGGTFVLALDRGAGGRYAVIPAPLSGAPLLVYPATPDVVSQVAELFGQ